MYNIKRIREATGLTQQALADLTGVPVRNIRAYEAESQTCHRSINGAAALDVYRMAQALHCEVVDLLEVDH